LDFGIIVAGAELGRLFADQGAEVIKIENRANPDGLRQSLHSDAPITASFAAGHRNKLSMGINLKSSSGIGLFKQLVMKSDVILSNFKPGTLDSLGLGFNELKKVNPRIVMADSSALGSTGPQSRSLGYGPLVRFMTGLTSVWCYPGVDNSFCDCNTIYPDHAAARVVAVGAIAELISRQRCGLGGIVSASQAETFLKSTSEYFLRESIEPGTFVSRGNASEYYAPEGVFPCAGDDEWCVVSVHKEDQWQKLACAIGRPDLLSDSRFSTALGRVTHRSEVEEPLAEWTRQRSPYEAMYALQAVGVPAGKMLRISEYEDDPHLLARGFFAVLNQPGLPDPIIVESGPTKALRLPEPEIGPAPYQAEHTRQIASGLLGLSEHEIDAFIETGDLEVMSPPKSV
jgi:crotonobetainyl-CoA:carnitine CoA-transferase CaiB-like acyl-CoA transferase